MTAASDLGRAALALARRGMAVFPVSERGKAPACAHGLKDATTCPHTVAGWWQGNPALNVGLATGSASGVWVLDVDGDNGEAELRRLEREHGELPPTVEAITGSGRHLYWRLPEEGEIRNSAGRIGPGLDTRGDGGYVLVPPSVHPSGRRYAWSVDSTAEFADAPEWLLERLTRAPKAKATPPEEWRRLAGSYVTEGHRNDALARLSGHLLRRYVDPLLALELLHSWNLTHCQPPLPENEVTATVGSIAAAELRRREARDAA